MADFYEAIPYLLTSEGGYVNDPLDSGGETNFGITLNTARGAGYTGSMRDMTRDQAMEIYRQNFWTGLDDVQDQAVATAILDLRANGVGYATRIVQNALNSIGFSVAVDGGWGPETLGAVNQADARTLIQTMASLSAAHYQAVVNAHPEQEHFLAGWMNRANRLFDLSEQAGEWVGENPGKSTVALVAVFAMGGLMWYLYKGKRK